jgi:hypothetical protein
VPVVGRHGRPWRVPKAQRRDVLAILRDAGRSRAEEAVTALGLMATVRSGRATRHAGESVAARRTVRGVLLFSSSPFSLPFSCPYALGREKVLDNMFEKE